MSQTRGAILLRVITQTVAALRLVSCPAPLHQLQILMAISTSGDGEPGTAIETHESL
jgi:hypothetical protein